MSDMIYTHISARVPGEPDHFLLNPHGMLFDEVTASSLLKVDLDGKVQYQPEGQYGLHQAGYVIHSALHRARPDANAAIHTHTIAGMAVSALKCGLLKQTRRASARAWPITISTGRSATRPSATRSLATSAR
jgi:ribulose-5-phosphate 4-epimerase/fuculose-1-phosphate aldolase